MRVRLVGSFVLLAVVTFARPSVGQASRDSLVLHCEQVDVRGSCLLYSASIIQLLARPEIFDGKRVRVIGFIHFEFEGNGFYLNKDDYDHALYSNGLWVEIKAGANTSAKCQDSYVLVEGVFQAAHHGHMGLWGGAIVDITRCQIWA